MFGGSNSVTSYLNNNFSSLVSVASGINMKSTGLTTLYTAPASSGGFLLTAVLLVPTSISGYSVDPTVGVGLSPSYTEFYNGLPWTGYSLFPTLKVAISLSTLTGYIFEANDVVKLNVSGAASATTFLVTAYVFGLNL